MDMDDVEQGERYAKSPLTGNFYRVTAWVDRGDGKITAVTKEEVERTEVPDEWLEGIEQAVERGEV
jgi:hypothetical protein